MIRKELVAASAEPLILSLLSNGESYGYAIIQEIKARSHNDLRWTDGMLYPVLHRMERKGWIKSRWVASDSGRKRKYYSLKEDGKKAQKEHRDQWLKVHAVLASLWEGKMFDLEPAIAEWRRKMASQGISEGEVLDELESHLRDTIQDLQRSGLDQRAAFEGAVEKMGSAVDLKAEFRKAGGRIPSLLLKLKALVAGRGDTTLPALAHWTPQALQALAIARKEPLRFNHDFIGTEHLLLGLLSVDHGIASEVLSALGADRGAITSEIERIVGRGPVCESPPPEIPFTPRARRALIFADKEAKAQNQAQVSPGHILLGLLVEGGGVAALVLRKLGVRTEAVRRAVLNRLAPDSPDQLNG